MRQIAKIKRYLLLAASAAALSACGSSGSCSPSSDNLGVTLKMEAPTYYPANLAESFDAVVTITNTSNSNVSNLSYTIPAPNQDGNYTGVQITPNAGVGSLTGACTDLLAGASCSFTARVGANAKPGSFLIFATPNSVSSSSKLSTDLDKLKSSITISASLSLVDIPLSDTSFYVLPNEQTLIGSDTQDTVVYFSVLVKSNADTFDSIQLVDDLGNPLVASLVVPELGVQTKANGVNTYKVIIPKGTNIQNIQAFSKLNNNYVCNTLAPITISNSVNACSNNAVIRFDNMSNQGILSIQPNYFEMSPSYESQIITLVNIGSADVNQLQLPSLSGLFSISPNHNSCANITSLAPNASCSFVLQYNPDNFSGESEIILNYNMNKSSKMTIPYTGYQPVPQWTVLNGSASVTNSFSRIYGIAVNGIGNSFVVGLTNGSLYGGVANLKRQYFIAQYNTNGELVWGSEVTTDGSPANVTATAINLNQITSAMYVVGNTEGALSGESKISSNNVPDYFITKYSTDGNILWSVQNGESNTAKGSFGLGVASSADGSAVYVFGQTYQNLSGTRVTSSNNPDYFLARYNESGNLIWLVESGTTDISKKTYSTAVSVDTNNDVIITGYTNGTLSCAGGISSGFVGNGVQNGFVAKYSAAGQCIWVRQLGDVSSDILGEVAAFSVTTDNSNNIYITGSTNGLVSGSTTKFGLEDAFVSKLDVNGNIIWTTQIGGTGQQYSTNTIVYSNSTNLLYIGGSGGINEYSYIAKLNTSGNLLGNYIQADALAYNSINALGTDLFGNIYAGGVTEGDVNGQSFVGSGGQNLLLMKFK